MQKIIIIILILFIVLIGIIYSVSPEFIEWSNYSIKEIELTESIKITKPGIYKLTGTIDNGNVEVSTDGIVKLILNNVSITNPEGPAIYITKSKKVEINNPNKTTNTLIDGNTYKNPDIKGCIYSQNDLILSGNGKLLITANYENGIMGNKRIRIKSGNYTINAQKNALKANGNIEINEGNFNFNSHNDGIHTSKDLIINDSSLKINCQDDAIHADGMLKINSGSFDITGAEGLEANYVKINDGSIIINASDDGINAGKKAGKYQPTIEINGGNIIIKMTGEYSDGIDSNGDLYINGGIIDVTANTPFDYDGKAKYNGGVVIVNGKKITEIP